MMGFLDWCCGIRDPLWGTLGWMAVIIGIGSPFALVYWAIAVLPDQLRKRRNRIE